MYGLPQLRHADKLEKQMLDLDQKHDAIADIKSAHDSDERIDGKRLCSMSHVMSGQSSNELRSPFSGSWPPWWLP